ncbi:hypothetical protein C8J55DRAFT_566045 [Lentinula edodes]|uniref:TPR-like protein n=1 Tax=Lentinula lateritia TaxID=40482 RepID=A0A9W8ZT91_9AGAR|nr:hypothetical protein C8J55DRAFT_566045 [Lentinula edodes]
MYPSEPTNSPPIPTSSATDVPPTVIQRLNNANEETWLLLGRVAEKMGNSIMLFSLHANIFEQFLNNEALAIKHFTNCIEADPSDAQSWYLLGRAYLDNHNYTKASETFWEAVQRDDGNPYSGVPSARCIPISTRIIAHSTLTPGRFTLTLTSPKPGWVSEVCTKMWQSNIRRYNRLHSCEFIGSRQWNDFKPTSAADGSTDHCRSTSCSPRPHIRAAQDEHPRVATPAPPVQPLVWTSPFTLSATMPQLPSGIVEEDDHRGRPQGPSDSHSHLPTAHLPPSHPLTIPSGSDIDSSHCIMSGRKAYSPLPEESKRTERSRKTTYLFRKDTQRRVRRNRTSISIQPSPSPFPTTRTIGSASIGMTRKSLRQ